MSAELDNLQKKVSKMTDAADAAETLIKGLAARVRATAGDAAAANTLADQLDAKASELAQSVVDNTPAET